MTQPTSMEQLVDENLTDLFRWLDPEFISPGAWVGAVANTVLLLMFTRNATLAEAEALIQAALAARGCQVPIRFGYNANQLTATVDGERFHGPYVAVTLADGEEHLVQIGVRDDAVSWVDGVA